MQRVLPLLFVTAALALGGCGSTWQGAKKDTKENASTVGNAVGTGLDKAGQGMEKAGEKVKEVRVTHRLTESPSCIVADEHDMGGNLARILKAAGQKAPEMKPILEINGNHPLVAKLQTVHAASKDDPRIGWAAQVLFGQAQLADGAELTAPTRYAEAVSELLLRAV